MMLSDK